MKFLNSHNEQIRVYRYNINKAISAKGYGQAWPCQVTPDIVLFQKQQHSCWVSRRQLPERLTYVEDNQDILHQVWLSTFKKAMPMVKVMVNIIGWNHGLTRGFLFPLLQIFLDLSPGNLQLAGYVYIYVYLCNACIFK